MYHFEARTVPAKDLQLDNVVLLEDGAYEVVAIDYSDDYSFMGVYMHGHEGCFDFHVDDLVSVTNYRVGDPAYRLHN